ncbi:MAG: site-specific DNA-methyltransferase [Sebaldella sp.]|nr:site-specific DNA-methyltransferase [Sebaldella sp.]
MNGTTACKWDSVIPFDEMWLRLNKLIKPNGAIVLFGSEPFSSLLRVSNLNNFKYDWIWEKQKASNFMGAKYGPLKYHEVISVFSDNTHFYSPQKYKVLEIEEILKLDKKRLNELFISRDYDRFGKVDRRKTINNPTTNKEHIGNPITRTRNADDGYRNPKSIIKINKEINTNIHPTQKPVALMEYLIKTYTNEGDTVLDFTMGSFTTAIACLNIKRNFIGIELDENYFKIGSKRVEEHLKTLDYIPKIYYNV